MQMDKQLSDQERQRQEDEFYANTGKYYQQPEQQALNISGGLPTQEAANMIPNLQPVFDEKALYRDMLKVPSLAKEGVKGLFPSAVDNPAAVREWEYFSKLSPQEQQQFLVMKRAEQWKDLGNQVVMPTPGMPGSVSAAFQKGISPDAQPWVKGAQVQAQQEAELPFIAPKAGAAITGKAEAEKGVNYPKVRDQYTSLTRQWDTVDKTIDSAINAVSPFTAGAGAWVANIPGTPQKDLNEKLSTIRANIGFDKLQSMRENSPTGGALGNVSDHENKLLQAVQGSLDQGQSPAQLKSNLTEIKRLLSEVRADKKKAFATDYQGGGVGQPPALPTIDAIRQELNRRKGR